MDQAIYSSLIVTFIVFLAACQGEKEIDAKVFRYNQPNNITSLDPAFAKSQNNIWAVDHLYNGLVDLDSDMVVIPSVAKSWQISEDGLSYSFTLRDDVYFHKDQCFGPDTSRRVVASDFVYSFERLLRPETHSPGKWIFEGRVRDSLPFQAIDDTTFSIHLIRPFMPFLGILTMEYCSVVPHEAIDHYGDKFRSHPVGTGPFARKRWVENQALFLKRNMDYFDEKSHEECNLDGIKISLISDRKTAYVEFLREKLDYMSGLDHAYINDLLTKEGNLKKEKEATVQFDKNPYLNTEYIGINPQALEEDSPLRDREFRKALNLAIDRETLLQSLRNSVGYPARSGFIPRGLPAYDPEQNVGYSYDPARARKIISDYIARHGEVKPIDIHVNQDYLDIITFVVSAWEQIGVPCNIELNQSAVLREGMRKGHFGFFRASWIADYPDSESFLNVFYSKNPAPPNYTRFQNAEYDALYEKSLVEKNFEKRMSLYKEMNQILIDESPVIFLYYDESVGFSHTDVDGLQTNSFNLLRVHQISIKDE